MKPVRLLALCLFLLGVVLAGRETLATPPERPQILVAHVDSLIAGYKRTEEFVTLLDKRASSGASKEQLIRLEERLKRIVLKDVEEAIWWYGRKQKSGSLVFAGSLPVPVKLPRTSVVDAGKTTYLLSGPVHVPAQNDATPLVLAYLNRDTTLERNRNLRPAFPRSD